MDKRIGYGLTLKEALNVAADAIPDLPDGMSEHIRNFIIQGGLIWGELRDDGWRVYRAKSEDEFHL